MKRSDSQSQVLSETIIKLIDNHLLLIQAKNMLNQLDVISKSLHFFKVTIYIFNMFK